MFFFLIINRCCYYSRCLTSSVLEVTNFKGFATTKYLYTRVCFWINLPSIDYKQFSAFLCTSLHFSI